MVDLVPAPVQDQDQAPPQAPVRPSGLSAVG